MVFIFPLLKVVYYVNLFASVELLLHPWYEFHLIKVYFFKYTVGFH